MSIQDGEVQRRAKEKEEQGSSKEKKNKRGLLRDSRLCVLFVLFSGQLPVVTAPVSCLRGTVHALHVILSFVCVYPMVEACALIFKHE